MQFVLLFLVTGLISFWSTVVARPAPVPPTLSVPTPRADIKGLATQPSGALLRPASALHATLGETTGTVEVYKRFTGGYAAAAADDVITNGESLRTGADGRVIARFPDGTTFEFGENSEITIISAFPGVLAHSHVSGTILYDIEDTMRTVGIRSLGTLLELGTGTTRVEVDPESRTIVVQVLEGTVKTAYLDESYETIVTEIVAGETATIYPDEARVVFEEET